MGIKVCETCARVVDVAESLRCSRCIKEFGRRKQYRSTWERVITHAISLGNAESEEEYRKAKENLRHASKRYGKEAK